MIHKLGHEANGYFWEGIVELRVTTEAPALEGRFESDPEGGAFTHTAATGPHSKTWRSDFGMLRATNTDVAGAV